MTSPESAGPARRQAQPLPPGWYPNSTGRAVWWDGTKWATPAPVAPARVGGKSTAVAYVFALLLGGVGAHRFYLRRPITASVMLVIWVTGLAATGATWGWYLMAATAVWVIVDLFLIPGMVQAANARERTPKTELMPRNSFR